MELRTDRYKLKEIFPERAKRYAQKLHIKADDIEYVKKGIPIDPAEISIEDGERAAIRLVSTPRLDRDDEILIPDGAILDDFRESPVVLFAHDYSSLPVGKDIWIKTTKKGVLAKTVYANHQFAEDVFQCVRGGFLNSSSVGFIPVERITASDAKFKDACDRLEKEYGVPQDESKRARNIYTKWILLEHSDVPVASNTGALNIAVSKGELILDSKTLKQELGIGDDFVPVPITAKDTDLPITDNEAVSIEVHATEPEVLADGLPNHEPDVAMIAPPVEKETAPDLAGELASLRTDVAAILARLQVTPEPAPAQATAPLPAPPPITSEDIVIEPSPDNIEFEPSVPDKAYKEMLETYIKGMDFKRRVDEAVEVALAKIRGRVI